MDAVATMQQLQGVLHDAGLATVELGDRILVLPFGGRVIGLYPTPGLNALWVNPALQSGAAARELLASTGWINLGGDRTWISPEIDTHIRNPEDVLQGYAVPKSVDPGAYELRTSGPRTVTLAAGMAVPFRRSDETVPLQLSRTISVLERPPLELPPQTDFVGYRQDASLGVADRVQARPGLWHILQVPGGGHIEIPVRAGSRPRAFIGRAQYELDYKRLRCAVHTASSYKISLVAGDCRGMMVYLNTCGPRQVLLARRFPVLAAARYADVSCAAPEDLGHVQQVYVDDGSLGGFGEMEYHSPAVDPAGDHCVHDSSEVWAFAGRDLRPLAERILEL